MCNGLPPTSYTGFEVGLVIGVEEQAEVRELGAERQQDLRIDSRIGGDSPFFLSSSVAAQRTTKLKIEPVTGSIRPRFTKFLVVGFHDKN